MLRLLISRASDTKSFHVTGLPAILIIAAILAALIGIGIWIGRRRRRRD